MQHMRKYIIRKNFDENNSDELNAPHRTIFFKKEKMEGNTVPQTVNSNTKRKSKTTSQTSSKHSIERRKDEEILSTDARKIFDESLSAMGEYDKKRLDNIYRQLSFEKQISKELNEKLHKNLSKIASVELELVKKKNQLEEDLNEKTKELIESERFAAIGILSGKLAHELRTPLTVIKGSVGIIKHKKGTEIDNSVIEKLELMEESISRMNHQVEKVLNFVQKYPLDKKEESLKKIIQKSISLLRNNPNITIHAPKNDVIYKCDSTKMEIAIGNILLNAVQAIAKEIGQIVVEINELPNSVKITIQDSGNGVPENIGEEIFNPLVSTKMDGTGLGLSSVKNIVEQHDGTVIFSNNPTTFTITLPK